MTGENVEFQNELNEIQLKIQIDVKIGEKNDISKRKIAKFWEKLTILHIKFPQIEFKWQEKIQNFKVNSRNFDWTYKSMWKSENTKKTKDNSKGQNLQNFEKISQFYTIKFIQSDLKSQEKMQNFKANSTKFD